MTGKRIHILGASGSGCTTLGAHIAQALDCPHIDADDIFWEKTEPPYATKRAIEDRRRLLEEKLQAQSSWVLSGSVTGWGNFLKPRFTEVLFLSLPQSIRIERLRARELARFGERILPGGDMEEQHSDFLEWAKLYDSAGMENRSRVLQEHWMRSIPCPILRIDGTLPTNKQLQFTLDSFSRKTPEFSIKALKGKEAAPYVDSFFSSLGRELKAQAEDLFFVALSKENETLGAVRYCIEEGTHMLRGMLIAERARKQGIGLALLNAFDVHLKKNKISPIYCLPHQHLESFYGTIGFKRIPTDDAPAFLRERLTQYHENLLPDVIVMKRP